MTRTLGLQACSPATMLGLPLAEAVSILERDGYGVICVETHSKKGTGGDDARVVRQRQLEDGTVELVYSVFMTKVESE